ncbi:MAG TPA: M48 family metalloprotease [Allosphingosinicella sp.]|nr:M48 family metalloprotease [Allosphingosinicella sp.]
MTHWITRRAALTGLGCACCAGLAASPAEARIRPADMRPLVGPGYRPTEQDEQGLWHEYERFEEEIAGSNLLIQDQRLASYLGGVVERVGGPAAGELRVYLAHVPEFNAFMTPTGFMVVFSGLLTRMRDEAQLSGVLAHEAGHFLRRHHIRRWRDLKRRTDFFTILAMGAGLGGAATGAYLGDWVRLAGIGTELTLAAYSRELEAEADAMGVRLIAESGYDPTAMPAVWRQLIGELDASAAMRRRHRRNQSLLATHPAPESRMHDLTISAEEVKDAGRTYDRGRDRYLAAIQPHRQRLLDDQVKLNDPGASLYIIHSLAEDGWNGLLRFYEGEAWRLRGRNGDRENANQSYALAVAFPDAPPEAWRAHGYALIGTGRPAEGRSALTRYLAMAPDAPDAAMVRYSLQQ